MTSVSLTLGNTGTVTVTAGTSGSTSTAAPSTGSTGSTSAPSVPSGLAGSPVPTGESKVSWGMADDQTVYVNLRVGAPGPSAWVAYSVKHVFADGNAVLVREPNCVIYTGALLVGANLRRKGETYDDSYPGP